MAKKLHIALISTWYPTPGSTSGAFVRDQADALIDSGHKASVFMFRYFSPMQFVKRKLGGVPLSNWVKGRHVNAIAGDFVNFTPTRFSSNPIEAQKKAFLSYVENFFRDYIAKNGKPDVIHHHGVANYCYITAHLSKAFNIPYVITEHSMFIDKVDHFTQYETQEERLEMIRKASARMAVSQFYAEFNSQLFGAPFTVMPNMISNDFAEIPLPKFPKDKEKFHFLNIGELAKRKRQDILINAFAKAFKGNIEVHLTIAGSGKLEHELKKQIASLGMEEQIHLPGFKEQKEVIKLIDNAHVLVISSEKESFSMAAAESLFRGNPVLTTRCKGPEDFITELNGMACELNNVEDMQQKMKEIYMAYSSFNNLHIAEHARSLFSEKVIAQKLEELYLQVTSYQPA